MATDTHDGQGGSQEAASHVAPAHTGNLWQSGAGTGLVFGLMTALLMLIFLRTVHPVFTNFEAADGFGNLPPEVQAQLDWQNATFVFALLGGLTAASVAIAEGFRRKSVATIVVFGGLCLVIGAAFGAGAGAFGNYFFKEMIKDVMIEDLARAVRAYAAVFAIIGGGVGLAVGVLLGRRFGTAANCLFGGILAGVGAAFAYPVICALAIPSTDTNVLIPVGLVDQLLWCGLFTGLVGLIIPALAKKREKKTKK